MRFGGSLTHFDGISLAAALRNDKRVTSLDLSSNDAVSFIGPSGCAALASALCDLPALCSLDLRGNRALDEGGLAFVDALSKGGHGLKSLDLRYNHISGAVSPVFTRLAASWRTSAEWRLAAHSQDLQP